MGYTEHTPGFSAVVADQNSLDLTLGRQIDWSLVADSYTEGSIAVTLTANAAQGATSITVTALTGAVAPGTVLRFSADEFATVGPAGAAAGATAIPVEALVNALESGDSATVPGTGPKSLPAGLAMYETAAGKIAPRTGSSAAVGVLLTSATQGARAHALSGYGFAKGGVFFEQLMPQYASSGTPGTTWGTIKTELGSRFVWERYSDTRAA